MHTIELTHKEQTTTIKLYNDPEIMPQKRYTKFMYYLTLSMGIDFSNIGNFFDSLKKHIALGEKDDALIITKNTIIAMYNGLNGVDLSSFSWAHAIHSIDGKPINDYSNDNLQKILEDLSDKGLTMGHIKPVIMAIKKKLMPNLEKED